MGRLRWRRRTVIALVVGGVALLVIGWIAGTVWYQPRYAVKGLALANPDVLFEVETSQQAVALTIDDGPHPDITPGVLDLLRERGVQVTFFILGEYIPGNEHILERMRAEGHEIGNHLVEDRPAVLMSTEEFERQLMVVDPWVDHDAEHLWMRPGSGWFSHPMVEHAASHGYRLCLASVFPHDDRIHDPQTLAEYVLKRVYPGAIVVLHDGAEERATLVETLGLILDGLEERGFQVKTVSGLVALGD